MIRTIGMFGSEQSIRELAPSFLESGIDLVSHDYITVQEVLEELSHGEGVDVVLVIERMSFGVDQGKYGLVSQIRAADATVRIAFCADSANKDHEFENWCYKYRVYDIFYPDKKGDFNISEIANYIKKGRLTTESSEDSTKIDKGELKSTQQTAPKKKPFENISKRIAAKEKPVEVVRVVEKPIEIVKEVIKNVYVDRPVEVIKRQHSGSYLIAVFNLSRGAGATQTAVNIAEQLAMQSHAVVVVAMDHKSDLKYQRGKADYIVPEDDQADTLIHFLAGNGKHDYIILDFGTLFELSPSGKLLDYNLTDSKAKIGEFMRCHLHIGMGFSAEWHVHKIKYFSETDAFSDRVKAGEYVFFYDQGIKKAFKKIEGCEVYSRDETTPTHFVMQKLIGVDETKDKKRKGLW